MLQKVKTLIIEFIQATAFAVCIAFIVSILGLNHNDDIALFIFSALICGGVPVMLAKRFVVAFKKECK